MGRPRAGSNSGAPRGPSLVPLKEPFHNRVLGQVVPPSLPEIRPHATKLCSVTHPGQVLFRTWEGRGGIWKPSETSNFLCLTFYRTGLLALTPCINDVGWHVADPTSAPLLGPLCQRHLLMPKIKCLSNRCASQRPPCRHLLSLTYNMLSQPSEGYRSLYICKWERALYTYFFDTELDKIIVHSAKASTSSKY